MDEGLISISKPSKLFSPVRVHLTSDLWNWYMAVKRGQKAFWYVARNPLQSLKTSNVYSPVIRQCVGVRTVKGVSNYVNRLSISAIFRLIMIDMTGVNKT